MAGPIAVGGKKLSLEVGAIELHCEATSARLSSEDAPEDQITFCDADEGNVGQYFISVTAKQSTAASSFWRYLWANPNELVEFTLRPHGNEVATADQPHVTGQLWTPARKPDLGGEASRTASQTFETRLNLEGEPVLVPGP